MLLVIPWWRWCLSVGTVAIRLRSSPVFRPMSCVCAINAANTLKVAAAPVDIFIPTIPAHAADLSSPVVGSRKGKLGANAMKRVAAGAHLPTPWLFEHAKRPDDRDYCLDCSFLLVQALGIRFYS